MMKAQNSMLWDGSCGEIPRNNRSLPAYLGLSTIENKFRTALTKQTAANQVAERFAGTRSLVEACYISLYQKADASTHIPFRF